MDIVGVDAASTCWVAAETDTQSNIFDSSALKKLDSLTKDKTLNVSRNRNKE
jgi:hypothetical protein